MPLLRRLVLPVSTLAAAFLLLSSARPTAVEGELDEIMGQMRRQYKAATEGARDPARNEATLAALARLEALILEAKALEPTNLGEIPTDARPDHVRDYRHTMARLLSEVALAESELWHDDNEAAAKRLAASVRGIRDEGHDKFQPAEER